MNPVEVNMMVASISGYLYECLPEEDFECLALILNELSKSMFSMSVFERLCDNDKKRQHGHVAKNGGMDKQDGKKDDIQDDLLEDIALAEVDPELVVFVAAENDE